MHRLQLHYELSTTSDQASAQTAVARDAVVRNPLIDLLRAVNQAGSISAAARTLGFSYRHVWGELKRWQEVLGHDLVVWEKGQAARLTEFASKLLWAEAQAQAICMATNDFHRAYHAFVAKQTPVFQGD